MKSPKKKPTLLVLTLCAMFVCTIGHTSYAQLYDVAIKNPSFEDEYGNPSLEGWHYKGDNLFLEDAPADGGKWSFKCHAAPSDTYSISQNAAYQPIHNLPNGSKVFVRACIKVPEFKENLSGAPSLGLAIIKKNGDWKILSSRNASEDTWICNSCWSRIDISTSDTLVVFLNPGHTDAEINKPAVLFDQLVVKYDPTVDIKNHDISEASIYPNPLTQNEQLVVSYEAKTSTKIQLTSVNGINYILKSHLPAGQHTEVFQTSYFNKGIYILTIESRNGILRKKIMIK